MLSYHLHTAYNRGTLGGHMLDWAHQPHLFKPYRQREPLPLTPPRWSSVSLL